MNQFESPLQAHDSQYPPLGFHPSGSDVFCLAQLQVWFENLKRRRKSLVASLD